MKLRCRISTRLTTSALANAMTSTDAIASEADDHVDPQSSANCTIDFVSSSMKPAPRKKKCKVRLTSRVRLKPDTTYDGEASAAAVDGETASAAAAARDGGTASAAAAAA